MACQNQPASGKIKMITDSVNLRHPSTLGWTMKQSMQSRVQTYLEQRRSLSYKLRAEGQML